MAKIRTEDESVREFLGDFFLGKALVGYRTCTDLKFRVLTMKRLSGDQVMLEGNDVGGGRPRDVVRFELNPNRPHGVLCDLEGSMLHICSLLAAGELSVMLDHRIVGPRGVSDRFLLLMLQVKQPGVFIGGNLTTALHEPLVGYVDPRNFEFWA